MGVNVKSRASEFFALWVRRIEDKPITPIRACFCFVSTYTAARVRLFEQIADSGDEQGIRVSSQSAAYISAGRSNRLGFFDFPGV